jgi:hypothetical protein
MGVMRIFNKPRRRPVGAACPPSGVLRPTMAVGRAPSEHVRQRLVDCGIASGRQGRRVLLNDGGRSSAQSVGVQHRISDYLSGWANRVRLTDEDEDSKSSNPKKSKRTKSKKKAGKTKVTAKKPSTAECAKKGQKVSKAVMADIEARRTGKKPTKKPSKKTRQAIKEKVKAGAAAPVKPSKKTRSKKTRATKKPKPSKKAKSAKKTKAGKPKVGKSKAKKARSKKRPQALAGSFASKVKAAGGAFASQFDELKSELAQLQKQIKARAKVASAKGAKAAPAKAKKASSGRSSMAKKKSGKKRGTSATRKKASAGRRGKGKAKGAPKKAKSKAKPKKTKARKGGKAKKGSRRNTRKNISPELAEALSALGGTRVRASRDENDAESFAQAREALTQFAGLARKEQRRKVRASKDSEAASRLISKIKSKKGLWGKEAKPKTVKAAITPADVEKMIREAVRGGVDVDAGAITRKKASKKRKKGGKKAKGKSKKTPARKAARHGATANPKKAKKKRGKKAKSKAKKAKGKAKAGKRKGKAKKAHGKKAGKRKGKAKKAQGLNLRRALEGAVGASVGQVSSLIDQIKALKSAVKKKGGKKKGKKGKKAAGAQSHLAKASKTRKKGGKKKAKGKRKGGKKAGKRKAKGKAKKAHGKKKGGKKKGKKAGKRANGSRRNQGVAVTDFASRNPAKGRRVPVLSTILDYAEMVPVVGGMTRPVVHASVGLSLGLLGSSAALKGLDLANVKNRALRVLGAVVGGGIGAVAAHYLGSWCDGGVDREKTCENTMRTGALGGTLISAARVALNATDLTNPLRALVGTAPQDLSDAVDMGEVGGDPAFAEGGVSLHENSQDALYEGSPVQGQSQVADELGDMDDFAAPAMNDFASPALGDDDMGDFATPAMNDFAAPGMGDDDMGDFAAPGMGDDDMGDFAAPAMGDDDMSDFAAPAA